MILYNVTYQIDHEIESQWLEWMKLSFLPRIMATGYFDNFRLYKLLDDRNEGATYSIQFFAESLRKVQIYLEKEASLFAGEMNTRYRNKLVAFRTVLQEIDV